MGQEDLSDQKIFISCPRGKPVVDGGGIGEETTDEDITEYFSQFGNVLDVMQLYHQRSGEKKGCGFVMFEDKDSVAKAARNELHSIGFRQVRVKRAVPKAEMEENKRRWDGESGDRENRGSRNECYKCGKGGHFARECPVSVGQSGSMEHSGYNMREEGGFGGGYGRDDRGRGGGGYGGGGGGGGGYGGGGGAYGGQRGPPQRKPMTEKEKVFHAMSQENSRSERMRRDADDYNPEAKIMRKLFVKNIPLDQNEAAVRFYFETFGVVEVCELATNTKTGNSKGFAFIIYEKAAGVDYCQAARPHKMKDMTGENEKELVTKRATLVEDKLLDKTTAKKIFIGSPISFTFKSGTGGLSEDVTDDDIKTYFSQFGCVTKVEQLMHPDTNRKKGVAFVSFDDEDCVDKIVLIGAHILKGRTLEAQKAISERSMNDSRAVDDDDFGERQEPTDPKDRIMRRVFMRNLPFEKEKGEEDEKTLTIEEEIKEALAEFGKTEDIFIPFISKNQSKTGRSEKSTFGFITFETMEAVDALMAARPIKIRDRGVTVRRAMPKGEDQRRSLENCKKIFLGSASGRPTATQGLDDSIEDKDLEEYFASTCGKVVNVKQLRDPRTDKHKGVGFVEFEDHDAVDKAVLLHIHIIKDKELMVSKADDNESRQVRDREMRHMRDTREMRMNLDSMRGGMGGFEMGMRGPGMGMGGPGMGMGGPGMGMGGPGMGMGGPGMGMGGHGMGMGGPGMGMGGPGMGMRGPGMGMGMGMDGPSMAGPGFGRGMGPRGGMGRGGPGGLLDPPGMGMGDGGMDFGGGYGPMGSDGPGFGNFRDQMGGAGPMGPRGGLMKRFKAFRPDPAMEGRRLQVEGLPEEVEDSAVKRYFQRFGALGGWDREEGWNRAKGHITYKETSMADYALKKKSHTIEGHVVTVARAEPEPEPPGEEEEDLPEEEDEYGMTMIKKMKMSLEGVLDADRDAGEGEDSGEMAPDEAATRAKMKEAGYSEEEIQTMIDAGCTEIAD